MINKDARPLEERQRTDKLLKFNVNDVEQFPESEGAKPLAEIFRNLSFLPFELNMKNAQGM